MFCSRHTFSLHDRIWSHVEFFSSSVKLLHKMALVNIIIAIETRTPEKVVIR